MEQKPEQVKVPETKPKAEESKSSGMPNLLELVGDVRAGVVAAKNTVYDKVTGVEQLGMQLTNAGTKNLTGFSVFSKESIDALAPQDHHYASAHSLQGYFEALGQAAPLALGAYVAHKYLGAAGTGEALAGEKLALNGERAGFLNRAKSLTLRETPLGLSVRNAAAFGFASEFVNPTDTTKDDSLFGSLKTRTVDGSIGAVSMASMSAGTVGAQAAWQAAFKTGAKDAAATVVKDSVINSTLKTLKRAGTNAVISAAGSVPGGVAGYLVGSEVHGTQINLAGVGDSVLSATAVGGTFGGVTALRGTPDAVAKTNENTADAPRTGLSSSLSTRFSSATQAAKELLFGRESDVGQLGTALASDAKGKGTGVYDDLSKSWQAYIDFAGGSGKVQATDVERVLKGIDAGVPKLETMQLFADGGHSAEQKAIVAASVRPESRAAFLKLMEVSRDGSAPAEAGFARAVSADKQTVSDLKMMTDRIGDPNLTRLVEAAANHTPVESATPPAPTVASLDALDEALARAPKPIIEPVAEPQTDTLVKIKTQIDEEGLRHPVADGFLQLADATKITGTAEHAAAFFASVDNNPRILPGIKGMAEKIPSQSLQDLAAMAEKPALRQAFRQLVDVAKDGSTDAQKQAFIDTVNNNRSVIPDLKKLAAKYDAPGLQELVRAAETADLELTYKTPQEGRDLGSAALVLETLVKSGDTTQLNSIVRDNDSLVNLQPHLRAIAERLGGDELLEKVDAAYAGRYEKIDVPRSVDEAIKPPKEVQSVSVRSTQVKDFSEMMKLAELLHKEFLPHPEEKDAVPPDWYYSLLKARAQSESGQAFESVAKEYAAKMNDPRLAALINDAYLPKAGIELPKTEVKNFQAQSEREAHAYGPFTEVMQSWPKVAPGETPSPASVLEYRNRALHWLNDNQDVQRMVVEYGAQTNSSYEASVIDFFYATKNLERFKTATPEAKVDNPELRQLQQDQSARALLEGHIGGKGDKFVDKMTELLGSPAPLQSPYSIRMYNGEPRLSQANPVAGAGTWAVSDLGTSTIAHVSGHPENLLQMQDFENGMRIAFYGRNGGTDPYTMIHLPENINIKSVNPSPDGSTRFRIDYPLQGNYINADFPPDSNVSREVRWNAATTTLYKDGSHTIVVDPNWKPFDPVAYDSAQKVEYKARESAQQRAENSAETNRLLGVMSDPTALAKDRLDAAKNVKPGHMSVEQFKKWLEFAGDISLDGQDYNYHHLDAAGLESMKSKFDSADYTTWAERLKDYLTVPESGTAKYPDWLARQDFASMPGWLKSDVFQRFNPKGNDASERLPAQVVEYFQANAEPQETKTKPFRRIGDDSVSLRLDRLDLLNSAKDPDVTARLMNLGAQDGRALQDVVKLMTSPWTNSVEYKNLLATTLPNAKDIYSVKVMLDALDKAGSRDADPVEKANNIEIAKRAAAAMAGNARQASIAKDLITKISRRETVRGPKDFSTLARYTLAAPSAEPAAAPTPWKLGGTPTAPEVAEKPAVDVDGGIGSVGSAGVDSAALRALRGETEGAVSLTPEPEAAAVAPLPAPELAPAEIAPTPDPAPNSAPENLEKPAEDLSTNSSSVEPDANTLSKPKPRTLSTLEDLKILFPDSSENSQPTLEVEPSLTPEKSGTEPEQTLEPTPREQALAAPDPLPAVQEIPTPVANIEPALEPAPEPTLEPAPEPVAEPVQEHAPESVEKTEAVSSATAEGAEALSRKIEREVYPSGSLFNNQLYITSNGREFMIDPSGATFERVSSEYADVLRWQNVKDESQIWLDEHGHVWDLNGNIATARELPEGVKGQVINFATEDSKAHALPSAQEIAGSDNQNPGTFYAAGRDTVRSTFYDDDSAEFSYTDGSRYIQGPRKAETNYQPTFETYKFASQNNSLGLTLTVDADHTVKGVLPNGIGFSADDIYGRGTVFNYPNDVSHYADGTKVYFDHNSVIVGQENGHRIAYFADGTSQESPHLNEAVDHALEQLFGAGWAQEEP